jgi:hypothetical protein
MPTYKAKWRVDCSGKTYAPGAELPEHVVNTLKESGAHAVVETIEDPEPEQEKKPEPKTPKKEAAKAQTKQTKAETDKTEPEAKQ